MGYETVAPMNQVVAAAAPLHPCVSDQPSALCALCEATGCLVFVLREDLSIAFCCALAEPLTGRPIDEFGGQGFCEAFALPGEAEALKAELVKALESRHGRNSFEWELLCSDGRSHRLAWTALRLDAFEGAPALLAIGRDVSVQRAAREAIQEREARLQAIFDAAVDGIVTTDERGIIESVNPTAEQIFGYSASELIGKKVSLLMPSPYREAHDRYMGRYIETGEKKIIGFGREVEGLRKDGTTFAMELGVSEVQTGERRLFTGIVRDITERKRTQEQLLQAERLAAIGEMVAGLAHESRNAFQRSKASLELLEMEVGDQPDAVALVQQIQRAQDHIYHLYEEVRHFAAPINLKCQPCDLARVWRHIWNDLDVGRDGKVVRLQERCSAIGLTCYADAVSLGQAFRNIFENAIDACPNPGEVVIDCADVKLHGRAALQINVTDNGPGLESESHARIFEPFFTTKTKGTGLGMAITRRIIQAHGGTIQVGRMNGGGATIVLTLPREKP